MDGIGASYIPVEGVVSDNGTGCIDPKAGSAGSPGCSWWRQPPRNHLSERKETMRQAGTFAKRINDWELLNTNIKPHLPDMPHLQGISTELDALIVQSKELDSQQEIARGQLQDLVHQRQSLEKQGETLRRRAGSVLKGSLGFTSDDLVKFGIRPRKTGSRGPRKPKPPVTPETPETPAPVASKAE